VAPAPVRPASEEEVPAPTPGRGAHVLTLFAHALREPLRALRRSEAPPELILSVERVAWQARMLNAAPRPMKAKPSSPIGLLQEAAEQVEWLRLGKVAVSWGLMTRQPVHVDPERARGAFRELLQAGAEATGEGGRLAIRIHEGEIEGYPVQIEIEIGRRGAEPDPLPARVARHLLESQGARVEIDATLTRISLRAQPPERLGPDGDEDGGPL
jgi:hypothetical protein